MGLKFKDKAEYLERYVALVDEFINGEADEAAAQGRLDELNEEFKGRVGEPIERIRGADRLTSYWESSQC